MKVFFKNSNFRLFATGSFLSSAGDVLFYLAFMTYASNLKNYSLAISLIAISEAIPKFFTLFGGYLADKTRDKFKSIFNLALVRCILYTIVGLLLTTKMSDWNLVMCIALANFISDTFGTYSSGLVTPLIVAILGKENYAEGSGFANGMSQTISMLARFAGASMLLFMSYSSLAFINAATFLIAGILFALVGKRVNTQKLPLPKSNKLNFFQTLKTSFKQVKKQNNLLTMISILVLLNAVLAVLIPLFTIILATHKQTMLIGSYSFTLAIGETIVGSGMILGSLFGPTIFKKTSVFLLAIYSSILALFASLSLFINNLFVILGTFALLTFFVATISLKMNQWLISSVESSILGSTASLLNTLLMASDPFMTMLLSSITAISNVYIAISVLLCFNVLVIFLIITAYLKNKALKANIPLAESEA
ncbi:MFS transporter [Lactobacillus jensenii]|uniref:MFS transporter n=1 Tax=Lactobacillus jensenii TaxID=109790 RepID=UPI001F08EC55|nr:MFS transporter [Lactobacillus jensenii]